MDHTKPETGTWITSLGGVIFIVVLFVSAYWEADIRWLHLFQAWVYLATIGLVWMDNKIPKLLIAFAGTTGFFALAMALFQPRYFALFPRCLHPKLHL